MHQVILRSSIRQMRHAAKGQKHLYRTFSSTTNNTTASRGTSSSGSSSINNKNSSYAVTINVKNDPPASPLTSSSVVESVVAKAGNGSSLSTANVGKISIGNSTSISPKSSKVASNFTDSKFVAKSSFSNSAGSSSSSNNDDGGSSGIEFRSVYVHPLSQVVLEYLQVSHHQWVVAKGLDQSLTLRRDGSFELRHTSQSHASMSTSTPKHPYSSMNHKKDQRKSDSGPIISISSSATAAIQDEKKNKRKPASPMKDTSNNDTSAKNESKSHQQHKHEIPIAASSIDENNNLRIWTSYDEQEKKHWLTIRRGLFRQRFLLQDNLLTAWQANRGISLQESLHIAVDEMIEVVNRSDRQQQQQATSIGLQRWQQRGQRRFRKR